MYRVRLPSKPSAELAYSLQSVPSRHGNERRPRLIVFLNNLLAPATSWTVPISILASLSDRAVTPSESDARGDESEARRFAVPVLTYDRFGQGASVDHDPLDSRPGVESGYGHDFVDVVADLRELITTLIPTVFSGLTEPPTIDNVALLLVGASIGAPLARLYAETYPHTVAGLVSLDSNIANGDYRSFWPDANSSLFDARDVIEPDCTLEQFLEQTRKLISIFGLEVKNNEHLDRRNTPQLLPYADRPLLHGPDNAGQASKTKILIVGHDPERFAQEGLERMSTPKSFTKKWTQPAWERYNSGLLNIGDSGLSNGRVRIAKGCGHFIQKDDPEFVARAVHDMMLALGW